MSFIYIEKKIKLDFLFFNFKLLNIYEDPKKQKAYFIFFILKKIRVSCINA
jgi:hypothetical protein